MIENYFGFIYLTYCKITGKVYIGQHTSSTPDYRYFGGGFLLKQKIKQYGKCNFERHIIEYCYSKEELNIKEQYWIQYFQSNNPEIGYNLDIGGGFSKPNKKPIFNRDCPIKNKICIQKDGLRKYIKIEDFNQYNIDGWILGNKKQKEHIINQAESNKKYYKIKLNNTEIVLKGREDVISYLKENYNVDLKITQFKIILRHDGPFYFKTNKYKTIDSISIERMWF